MLRFLIAALRFVEELFGEAWSLLTAFGLVVLIWLLQLNLIEPYTVKEKKYPQGNMASSRFLALKVGQS